MVPTSPLQLIAGFKHPDFAANGNDLSRLKSPYRVAVDNCSITISFGTQQMTLLPQGSEIHETICQARAEAIAARATGRKVLQAQTLEDFQKAAAIFRTQYDTLVASVRHYYYVPGPEQEVRRCLYSLVERQM